MVESFQHKIDLVVEGHQMLAEKIDRVETRLDQRMDGLERKICVVDNNLTKKIDSVEVKLTKKIDAIATDLKAHRADTEAHTKIYKIKET
jgi:hypothetical protein